MLGHALQVTPREEGGVRRVDPRVDHERAELHARRLRVGLPPADELVGGGGPAQAGVALRTAELEEIAERPGDLMEADSVGEPLHRQRVPEESLQRELPVSYTH